MRPTNKQRVGCFSSSLGDFYLVRRPKTPRRPDYSFKLTQRGKAGWTRMTPQTTTNVLNNHGEAAGQLGSWGGGWWEGRGRAERKELLLQLTLTRHSFPSLHQNTSLVTYSITLSL